MNRLVTAGILMLIAFVFSLPASQAGPSFDNDELHISVDVDDNIQNLVVDNLLEVQEDLTTSSFKQTQERLFSYVYIKKEDKHVKDIIVVPIDKSNQSTINNKEAIEEIIKLTRHTGHIP